MSWCHDVICSGAFPSWTFVPFVVAALPERPTTYRRERLTAIITGTTLVIAPYAIA
jgi:hypothetical protein